MAPCSDRPDPRRPKSSRWLSTTQSRNAASGLDSSVFARRRRNIANNTCVCARRNSAKRKHRRFLRKRRVKYKGESRIIRSVAGPTGLRPRAGVGVNYWVIGAGAATPSPTVVSGGRCKLPRRGSGRSPDRAKVLHYFQHSGWSLLTVLWINVQPSVAEWLGRWTCDQ